jgi:hypothetical protein
MIISPRATHSSGILVVRDNVVVVGELFVADCAYSFLLGDFPLQKFPHFGGGSELSVAPRMMRVLNASNSRLKHSHTMRSFSPAAADRFVGGTVLVWTEFHGQLQGQSAPIRSRDLETWSIQTGPALRKDITAG